MIAAVSALVESGHRVVFDKGINGGSHATNLKTGRVTKIFERNGVYEIPIWVKKPKPASGAAGSFPAGQRR